MSSDSSVRFNTFTTLLVKLSTSTLVSVILTIALVTMLGYEELKEHHVIVSELEILMIQLTILYFGNIL